MSIDSEIGQVSDQTLDSVDFPRISLAFVGEIPVRRGGLLELRVFVDKPSGNLACLEIRMLEAVEQEGNVSLDTTDTAFL